MAISADNTSMAVFCDFENVALGVRDANYEKFDIKPILEHLLVKGSIVVKKAYCDWERYKAFKATMHEANFELIEIPHLRISGKNSADIRLVVDALDLCYTKAHVNTFVIISGDSDFSPLVSKLRENAKQVIGVGVKQSTSDLLIANCDEFIFYDDLVREQRAASRRERGGAETGNGARRSPEEEKHRKDDLERRHNQALTLISETLDALFAARGDSCKTWASVLKQAVKRRKPDFNESYYGFRSFGNLVEEAGRRGLLEFGRDEKSGLYVYRSETSAPLPASLATAADPEASPPSETRLTAQASPPSTAAAAVISDAAATPALTTDVKPEIGSAGIPASSATPPASAAATKEPASAASADRSPDTSALSATASSDPATERKARRPHKPARLRAKEARETDAGGKNAEARTPAEPPQESARATPEPAQKPMPGSAPLPQATSATSMTSTATSPAAAALANAPDTPEVSNTPRAPRKPRKPAARTPDKPAASGNPTERRPAATSKSSTQKPAVTQPAVAPKPARAKKATTGKPTDQPQDSE